MHKYRVFGLSLHSDIRLDELIPEQDPNRIADISIVRTDIGEVISPLGSAPPRFDYENKSGVLMIWPGVAGFRIIGPQLVEISPHPDAPEKYLAFPILGPVLAWVLHMRKFFVLHASAVLWHEHSVAFMGDKMAGKSTTAASFIRTGAKLLTDDLLAIDTANPAHPKIRPAFPQLKLSDDAAEGVHVPGSKALPLVFEEFDKRQFKLSDMHNQPVSCDTLFVIHRGGEKPKIDWLPADKALTSLMRFSYNVRFYGAPVEMQDRARHFRQCASLVNSAKVGRLTIPWGLERLPEMVQHVRDEILADLP